MADKDKVNNALKNDIVRETVKISSRYLISDTVEEKLNINTSLLLLNSAATMSSYDETYSRRLYNVARRISREKDQDEV